MSAWSPWVEEALERHGPEKAELAAMADRTRVLRDAMQLQQWETAFAHGEALYAFLAQERQRQQRRVALSRRKRPGRAA
jgi:hypothetical protein